MKLALFFTRNVSLQEWVDRGLFGREKLLYERHLQTGFLSRVFWLTYGAGDGVLAGRLQREGRLHSNIEVLPLPRAYRRRPARWLYPFLAARVHGDRLREADVFKTNQADGAWAAAAAARRFGKPLVVRTGYAALELAEAQGAPLRRRALLGWAESRAYRRADAVLVASPAQRDYVCGRYGVPAARVRVLPNYVDTERFCPLSLDRDPEALVFVGRLMPVKNLESLVTAAARADRPLVLYGDGPLREPLARAAAREGCRLSFRGAVPNADLPRALNGFRTFVLPSTYEGAPKALLEAMACGLVCVGTDVPGIRAVIRDGENGYLARGPDPDALAEAVRRAAAGPWAEISGAAAQTIRERHALSTVAAMEQQILREILP
jgi:glycosyltransferase involved in cell wall biosynthesis